MKRILVIFNMLLMIFVSVSGIKDVVNAEENTIVQPLLYQDTQEEPQEKPQEKVQKPVQVNVEPEVQETTEVIEKEYRYIDCALSTELQQGIFDICESYGVSFEFVMAVIAQESSFRPNVTGDNGHSKGLMQVQERYHGETMETVGVSDLYDPLGNVEVGVAILQRYFDEVCDVYHVLMRYNGGEPYATNMMKSGKVSDYAKKITERAIEYEIKNGI